MLRIVQKPTAVEPDVWFVVFHTRSDRWWLNRLPLRFKHVSAFAYVHAPKVWLLYDVQLCWSRHIILPDNPAALDFLAEFTDGCAVLHMKRERPSRLWFRAGFWCVPAIKHLLGLRSGALVPDQLYRHCLRAGAKVINGHPEVPAAGRPEPAGRAGRGAAAEGRGDPDPAAI